jgi:hypothetical protein
MVSLSVIWSVVLFVVVVVVVELMVGSGNGVDSSRPVEVEKWSH